MNQPVAPIPVSTSSVPSLGLRWLGIGATLVLIGWFYLWTAMPPGTGSMVDESDRSYYNLLVRGWLKGQLALDVPDDPFLASLADPYVPANREGHGLHDASYYRGKYYLYFGVTPVVLLQLPVRLLFGTYITDAAATVVFSYIGFLLGAALLRAVFRTHFPRTPLILQLACLVALGLGTMVPALLRRPAMWEVPIACAHMLFMLVLLCAWYGLAKPGRTGWWAVASLAMGLCIGARPVYLFGSLLLLAPLPAMFRTAGWRFWADGRCRRMLLAVGGPIVGVGVGLALYNWMRFDHPFEFGQTYQLSGSGERDLVHFSPSYIWFNIRVYLFSLPGLTPYFPFLTVISPPPVPAGQFGIENPYGIVPGMPWVLFATVAAVLAWRRPGPVATWCLATLAGVAATMATIFSFGGVTGRYEVDFTPGLVLVGAVGVMWLLSLVHARVGRLALILSALALAFWSAGFNVLVSLQHNRLLQLNHPEIYARVAHAFNRVPQAVARLTGHESGPVEIRLTFPSKGGGAIEPILATGREFLADYIFVHYLSPGLVRFGLEHTSQGTWTGQPVEIEPGREHVLEIQMGSLYPPPQHPDHDGLSGEERAQRLSQVWVKLDSRTVLRAMVTTYDSTEWTPAIGTSRPARPGFPHDFSGRIAAWRRIPPVQLDTSTRSSGPLHLVLSLPEFARVHSEPLLSSGVPGKGDLIYLRYVDARHVILGHDQWGRGGWVSEPIEIVPGDPFDLDLSCPPLLSQPGQQRLKIRVNGRLVVDRAEAFHPSTPDQVVVAMNVIGATTAEASFTGVIELQERVKERPPAP